MDSSKESINGVSANVGISTALFIGVHKDPKDIIKGVMTLENEDKLVGILSEEDNVESFKWKLDNKYYAADIELSILKSKFVTSPEFAESVEAIILCVDTNKESCLTDLETWLPFIKDYCTSIEMFVCQNCNDLSSATPKRNDVIKWCLDNEFEFVELEPQDIDKDDDEEEEDYHDVFGVARISQALHAHLWPNLKRKERTEPMSFDALKSGGAVHEEILANSASSSHPIELEDKISQLLAGRSPAPDMEFGELFQELANMKERMSGMDTDRRKKTAEQIVMAFWKGIGGDEEELELSEEEDK